MYAALTSLGYSSMMPATSGGSYWERMCVRKRVGPIHVDCLLTHPTMNGEKYRTVLKTADMKHLIGSIHNACSIPEYYNEYLYLIIASLDEPKLHAPYASTIYQKESSGKTTVQHSESGAKLLMIVTDGATRSLER